MIRRLVISCCLLLAACGPREKLPKAPPLMLDSAASGVDCRVRALQFYEADQLDSALALYTRATQYNRNDKYAWHGIAATLGRLGRYDEALPAYDEALRIDSNYVGAIWHRACGYANALQKDKALSDLRRAIALDSTVKQDAQQDKCFEWMWGDSVYLSVVR